MTDIADSLSNYIYGQANQTLKANGLPSLSGGSGMSVPGYSLQASASSSAKGESGDISGGTAFNIGGINLGQQYQSPATVSGGNPAQSVASAILGPSSGTIVVVGAIAAAALLIIVLMRR